MKHAVYMINQGFFPNILMGYFPLHFQKLKTVNIGKDGLETKEDLSKHEVKLENKIGEFKVDILRWMFAFWITVILMFIRLYFKS